MEKKEIRTASETRTYEKPVLTKHGKLTDITTRAGSVKNGGELGCTRL